MPYMVEKLPQTGTQFGFQILLQLAPNFVNLNIGQDFGIVLNREIYRIRKLFCS